MGTSHFRVISFFTKDHYILRVDIQLEKSSLNALSQQINMYDILTFFISFISCSMRIYQVYMKKGGKPNPNTEDYDFSYKLPDFSTCKVGNDTVRVSDSQSHDAETLHIDPKNCEKDPYTAFVSNLDFNGHGEYCFGEL